MCSAYTTTFDVCEFVCVCECVCMCSRCAAVSYLRLCHRYVRSLKARPNDHYYHKHISNSRPSERFKLQFASALSCVYVCMYVCMQLTFSCRLLFLFLLIFCTLSFRTRSRQFIVHFISLHLISQIPKRTTFYFPAIAVEPTSPSLSLSLSLSLFLSFSLFCLSLPSVAPTMWISRRSLFSATRIAVGLSNCIWLCR